MSRPPRFIRCMTVEQLPEPHVPSDLRSCAQCGAPLWVAWASLAEHPFLEVACNKHFEPVRLTPPTPEAEYLRRAFGG